jgi:tRNA threonylcarbamoyladenosine biosynthesis protein TsaB
MHENITNPPDSLLLLAIDTCGDPGAVALGRYAHSELELIGQIVLEGRSFSSTLVNAVGEVLAQSGVTLRDLGGIVAVNGPGSFTGVRVGLSAVKGFAEAAGLPVLAVSRLAAMSAQSGEKAAALDAHRHEVFLHLGGAAPRELLAGALELAAIDPPPARIAVCDEAAATLIAQNWPQTELVRTLAPTAASALALGAPRLAAGECVDVALLDGHYLRRSDAEIFGDPSAPARAGTPHA